MKVILCGAVLAFVASLEPIVLAQSDTFDLRDTLARAGAQVEAFFARAQSLICIETVVMQPLNSGLGAEGFSRTVESELRVSWDADDGRAVTEAQTRRQVIKVNGRPPRDDDHRRCTTPEQADTETQPLSMLLPQQREKYRFATAGTSRIDGRLALVVEYREVARPAPEVRAVEGLEDCISYELNGGQRGRLWIDAASYDVLRLDQRLIGMVDLRLPLLLARRPGSPLYMTLERADASLRFGRVSFAEPSESLVLPLESSELRIVRGGGISRLRTTTTYSTYKRFLTGSRVVG